MPALQIKYVDGNGMPYTGCGVLPCVQVANECQNYRGAVQPAESGASGNEVQNYRGAVEPAAAATTRGHNRAYIAITRRTAEQMTVKQRMAKPKQNLRDLT